MNQQFLKHSSALKTWSKYRHPSKAEDMLFWRAMVRVPCRKQALWHRYYFRTGNDRRGSKLSNANVGWVCNLMRSGILHRRSLRFLRGESSWATSVRLGKVGRPRLLLHLRGHHVLYVGGELKDLWLSTTNIHTYWFFTAVLSLLVF